MAVVETPGLLDLYAFRETEMAKVPKAFLISVYVQTILCICLCVRGCVDPVFVDILDRLYF